jgi:hypothetical protein
LVGHLRVSTLIVSKYSRVVESHVHDDRLCGPSRCRSELNDVDASTCHDALKFAEAASAAPWDPPAPSKNFELQPLSFIHHHGASPSQQFCYACTLASATRDERIHALL